MSEWRPSLNKCHENVDLWVANHSATNAVRGWLFWQEDGPFTFVAHSVIEENGTLIDITPIGGNIMHEGLRFLTHLGSEEEFQTIIKFHAHIYFPPFSNDDILGRGGELDEDAIDAEMRDQWERMTTPTQCNDFSSDISAYHIL